MAMVSATPNRDMKLQLRNFRKFKDMNFTMGTSIVKIAGDSGAGKSTVLDSICWVLYGKLQKVKPRDGSGQTEVVFEYPYKDTSITIRRRGRNDLCVWINDELFEGDRAQGIIDDYFGTAEAFRMTSYLPAESMHKFISATPSEKKEITHLLFPDINTYDKYCMKLKEKRKEEERIMEERCGRRVRLSSSVEALSKNHTWLEEYNDTSSIDDINSLLEEYNLPTSSIPSHMDIQRMAGEYSSILGRYEMLMEDCVPPTSIDVQELERKIEFLGEKIAMPSTSYLDIQSRIANASSTLSKYNMLVEQDVPPEHLDVDNLQSRIGNMESSMKERMEEIERSWSSLSDLPLSVSNIQKYIRECYSILGRYETLVSQQIEEPEFDHESSLNRISEIKEQILSSRVSTESRESKLAYLNGSLQSLMSGYDGECLKDLDLTRRLHSLCPSYEDSVRNASDLESKIRETELLLLDYEESLSAMEYNSRLSDILTCPRCQCHLRYTDSLQEVDDDVQPRTVQYRIDKADVESLRLTLSNYRKSHVDLLTRISEYDKVVSNHSHIGDLLRQHGTPAKYNRYIADMKMKKDRIDSLSLDIESILSDTSRYLSQSDMDLLSSECTDLENKLSQYNSDVSRYSSMKMQLEKLKQDNVWLDRGVDYIREIEKILERLQQLEMYRSTSEGEKQSLISKINTYTVALSKHNSIRSQIESLLSANSWLERGESYIDELETELEVAIRSHADIDSMKREMSNLESSLSSYKDSLSKYLVVKSKIDSLTEKNSWLTKGRKYIEDLQSLSAKIVDYNKRLEMKKIHQSYSAYKKKLAEVESLIQKNTSRLELMARLESLLNEAYRRYVDNKMKEIEYDVSILGKMFFDESMNITIVGDKGDKPSFDIMVEHEGTVCEDVRAMSTGERKRLSIIMMMVLSKYLDTKIMMLDEAFSSIGMDSRGVVLAELAKMGISILLTSHDEVPGGYYEVLSLD